VKFSESIKREFRKRYARGREGKVRNYMKNKTGRPSKLTLEIREEICLRIAEGESLRKILESDPKRFPTKKYVLKALETDKDFRTQYARAREYQADHYADEILEIADDGSRDYTKDSEGRLVVDHDHIQRARLRIEARKWTAAKLKPKKYGDRITHAGDEENPLDFGVIYFPAKKPVGAPAG
jgi:terminase small subunit-like protein